MLPLSSLHLRNSNCFSNSEPQEMQRQAISTFITTLHIQGNIIHSPLTLTILVMLSRKFWEIESNPCLSHRTQYQEPPVATEQED